MAVCGVATAARRHAKTSAYWANPPGTDVQDALFAIPEIIPDLRGYDLIIVSISGGKDSQTALRRLIKACTEQGIPLSRIVCVYADLGSEVTWPGTQDMAAYHAARYGLRFITVTKKVACPGGGKRAQGLLERIEHRGHWPSPENRWCTSDFKRGPIGTVITMLVQEITSARARAGQPFRQVRVLSVMGIRGEESPKRGKMDPFIEGAKPRRRKDGTMSVDSRRCNTVRVIDEWLPIHAWTLTQVWDDIQASEINYHYAYHLVGRLSCILCIFAPYEALVMAARANLDKTRLHVEAEVRMAANKIAFTLAMASTGRAGGPAGWRLLRKTWRTHGRFRHHLSLVDVYCEALRRGPVDVAEIRSLPLADGWAA